jgi:hypothetical protein
MTLSHASWMVTPTERSRWERGKRELGIELRKNQFQEPALWLGGIGNRYRSATAREDISWRSQRPHASVDTLCTRTGRARAVPADVTGRQGKACGHNPCMYAPGKSDVGNSTNEPVEQSQPTGGGDGGGKYR